MKHLSKSFAKVIIVLIMVAVLLLPSAVSPSLPVAAAGEITLNTSVQTSFPNSITFKVKAQSSADIIRLRLHYTVERQNYASVVSEGWPSFTPSESVSTQWYWDMRRSSLPVGTQVRYWWTAEDAAGNNAETSPATVSFDDTRFKWQSITEDPVTLLWYNGDQNFAEMLMAAAQEGLQRIQNDTGAVPQRHIRIYIYGSASAMQGGQIYTQEWAGGVTYADYDVIAIGIPEIQLLWGMGAIRHELTHWVTDQIVHNNYGAGIPVWLSEGLATYGEGDLSADYKSSLDEAIANNDLLSVRSLSSPFSAISSVAHASYGESNSIVTFLIQTYGKDKMNRLLEAFHQGNTYDDALMSVYGFDQDGLDTLWRQSLGITAGYQQQEPAAVAAAK